MTKAEGLLCVFTEPGKLVSLEEFQDWYNNEHVPLRVNHLLCFLTVARYSSLDINRRPSWLAVYDISELSALQDESYASLRANRSEREAAIVKRLEILDRRICKAVWDSGERNEQESTSFGASNPTRYLVTSEVNLSGGSTEINALRDALERRVEAERLREGWLRTRAFRCNDVVKSGVDIVPGPEGQVVPKYLIIDEYSTAPQVGRHPALETEAVNVVEQRNWELYRAYPTIAQGNIHL